MYDNKRVDMVVDSRVYHERLLVKINKSGYRDDSECYITEDYPSLRDYWKIRLAKESD